MEPVEIFVCVGIIVANAIAIMTAWIRVKLRIKEIEIRLEGLNMQFLDSEKRNEKQMEKVEKRFAICLASNKEHDKRLYDKLDVLTKEFANFRVYVEKKLK